jgi:hypothetical protein
MSEKLLRLFSLVPRTKHDANICALRTYLEIEKFHGEDEARKIFARLGKKPSKRDIADRKGFDVLARFDMMEPRPNVDRLAEKIASETGRTPETAKAYINELRRKRREMIRAGTWAGPPYFAEFKDWGRGER